MTASILLGQIGFTEVLLILVVVLLLFGARKIPELMSGFGKGIKSFKDGMNGKEEEGGSEKTNKDKTSA